MERPGATADATGTRFRVRSEGAERLWLCLFDEGGRETRHAMERDADGWHVAEIAGLRPGAHYGFRAEGRYEPAAGWWYDPSKLLADPHATRFDRPWMQDRRLAEHGFDTAPLVPKSVVEELPPPVGSRPPLFRPGGLIYEVPVRAFSMRHPEVPEGKRGTVAALAEPAVVAHLKKLGVSAVELMPVTATIDERHLPALGLSNAWGYNPVTFMATDPRLAPGGIAELRETVAVLRQNGIGVILDLVFNHTGESDVLGPTLSLRGLDNLVWYRHRADGGLINDTGCGNTIACDRPAVAEHILFCLRHFVEQAGVDGFRFDLAPVLGRDGHGFSAHAPLFEAMRDDPVLADRVMIAEPWDIGPNGYQLGNFPPDFLEWNDRYRDDVRRFWRGDASPGQFATRLAGSSDIFGRLGQRATRTVNFIAAHDGFTLRDTVSYSVKHNEGNGEANRDGHNENFSWNGGVEGETEDMAIRARRAADMAAMLATLFVSRGTVMLTAGDEFGRTQGGNNNAYAQDNETTWLDWEGRDRALEAHVAALAVLRAEFPALRETAFLTGDGSPPDIAWTRPDGQPMRPQDWEDPAAPAFAAIVGGSDGSRLYLMFNRAAEPAIFELPALGPVEVRARCVDWRMGQAAGGAR